MPESLQTASSRALSNSLADIDTSFQVMPEPSQLPGAVCSETPSCTATETDSTFPEGGAQAWLVVFGSFCAIFCVFGIISSAAVFESYFAIHQLRDKSSSQIGWIFSLNLFITFFFGIHAGVIFDRQGPRVLVIVGSIMFIISWMLLGECTKYYQIILDYSVLGGFAGALVNAPAYGAVAHFFNRRRGLATGIVSMSGSISGIVFPLMLQRLFPPIGFAWSMRIIGFMIAVLAVPSSLFIRSRRLAPLTRKSSPWPDLSAFRDLKFVLYTAGIFFMEWGLFVPLTFVVNYARAHHQSVGEGYTVLAVLNAGATVGRVLPGFLADRIGRFNVIIMTIALCVVLVLGMWLPAGSSHPVLLAWAALFGFASGSNLGLIPACVGQLCDTKDFGRYYSTSLMVSSFGTLTGAPIGGALLDVSWTAVILFAGLSYVAALVLYIAVRVRAIGWSIKAIF